MQLSEPGIPYLVEKPGQEEKPRPGEEPLQGKSRLAELLQERLEREGWPIGVALARI